MKSLYLKEEKSNDQHILLQKPCGTEDRLFKTSTFKIGRIGQAEAAFPPSPASPTQRSFKANWRAAVCGFKGTADAVSVKKEKKLINQTFETSSWLLQILLLYTGVATLVARCCTSPPFLPPLDHWQLFSSYRIGQTAGQLRTNPISTFWAPQQSSWCSQWWRHRDERSDIRCFCHHGARACTR